MPASFRPRSLKFHAIAISIICVVIIGLYFIMIPTQNGEVKPYDPDAALGSRSVIVVDASWGLNCNTEIQRLRAQGHLTVRKGDTDVPLEVVKPNNAVYAVTELCADKISCKILASNDTLGLDPLSACYKQLTVGYRCFSVDRKWTMSVDQGELMTIDCHEEVNQAKATERRRR